MRLARLVFADTVQNNVTVKRFSLFFVAVTILPIYDCFLNVHSLLVQYLFSKGFSYSGTDSILSTRYMYWKKSSRSSRAFAIGMADAFKCLFFTFVPTVQWIKRLRKSSVTCCNVSTLNSCFRLRFWPSTRGGGEAITPPKSYESNYIHPDFVQFGKLHSIYEAISLSIVLSQKCCEVGFIPLTVVKL